MHAPRTNSVRVAVAGYCCRACEVHADEEVAAVKGAEAAIVAAREQAAREEAAAAKKKAADEKAARERAEAQAREEAEARDAERVTRAFRVLTIPQPAEEEDQPTEAAVRAVHTRLVGLLGQVEAAEAETQSENGAESEGEGEGEDEDEGNEGGAAMRRARKRLDAALDVLSRHLNFQPVPTNTAGDDEHAAAKAAQRAAHEAIAKVQAQREAAGAIQAAASVGVGSLKLQQLVLKARAALSLAEQWLGDAKAAEESADKAALDIDRLINNPDSAPSQEPYSENLKKNKLAVLRVPALTPTPTSKP